MKLRKWLFSAAMAGLLFASTVNTGQAYPISGQAIVNLALTHHEPYIYGTTDCSALTQKVYQRFGIPLPRTSRSQSATGRPVSKSHLKKGDLVFFATSKKGKINHVGIYAGSGKMVDAEYSGIRKTGIFIGASSHYWKSKFVKARRVI